MRWYMDSARYHPVHPAGTFAMKALLRRAVCLLSWHTVRLFQVHAIFLTFRSACAALQLRTDQTVAALQTGGANNLSDPNVGTGVWAASDGYFYFSGQPQPTDNGGSFVYQSSDLFGRAWGLFNGTHLVDLEAGDPLPEPPAGVTGERCCCIRGACVYLGVEPWLIRNTSTCRCTIQ